MRKDISPELYNYNKFPGPDFVRLDQKVQSQDYQFLLVEDVKDGFDAKVFSQRFSDILLKYDYIVGDWGGEQLRLKGFYKDKRKGKKYSQINYLEDYLLEYCQFGCAYFILENPNPQEISYEEEKGYRKKRKAKSAKNRSPKAYNKPKKRRDNERQETKRKRRLEDREVKEAKQHFVIRKKQ
ncbi:YutD family protein [Streptococcus sp. zg-JUN1979]|uniref:YutD family protein n=1 Tax=Streptococcus sp. zg-JUN1979 TaxID=3391450 RepID=UPI0039A6389C